MAIKKVFVLTALIGLSACATTNGSEKSAGNETEKAVASDRLSAKQLAQGECGLFVFAGDHSRKFVLFSQDNDNYASWWNGEQEERILRLSASGFDEFDQSPIQTFEISDGSVLKLELFAPTEVDNGLRYDAGSIKITNGDGWEKVTPVYGVVACNFSPVLSESIVRTIQ